MKFIALLLIFPIQTFAQKKYNFKNLVLEGGGVRGIAYAGVFSILEKKGILYQIENVAGSSAGSIAGMLVCIGYSAAEIDSIMIELPIQKFNDGKGGIFGKYKRFKKKYGIYKGVEVENWLQQLVKNKTGNPLTTFEDLHTLSLSKKGFKKFYCTGTNISKQQLEIFSYNTSPKMPVALAVRISSGVPLYFEPIALNNDFQRIIKKDTGTFINYYVDGGMLCNYPISMFDTCKEERFANPLLCNKLTFNNQTIGIKLERSQQIDSFNNNNLNIAAFKIKKLSDYINAFANLTMEALSRKYPNLENETGRTIYVNQGVLSPKIKKTKQQDKLLLYENGVNAANDFFNKLE